MNYKYVSINRIFAKLIRDLGPDFNEDDIIEWTGEALEFMKTPRSTEDAVAFIEVSNHQCKLPKNLHAVIQVARNMRWTKSNDICCPAVIATELTECKAQCVPNECKCCCDDADAVWIDCNGKPIVDYDLAYYRPYFDLQYEYYGWSNSRHYRQNYAPMRLSTNTMFSSLVCTDVAISPYINTCTDEYTIVNGDTIRTSFQTGGVAVAFTRAVLDKETGYPMIPDSISHTTAIMAYIKMMKNNRDLYMNREGAAQKSQKYEQDWQWYCKQASNADMMPYGEAEHQNLLNQRSYILPRHNQFDNFFGNLNKPENRGWNHR